MTTSACGVPGCTRCMQRYPSQTCQWSCQPADLHFHSPLANMPWFAEGDCGFRFGWFCWSNDICFVLHKKTVMWNCETIKIWSKCPPPQWIFPVESWLGKSCFPSKTEFFAVSRCFGDGWGKDSEETSWGFKPHPWRTLQLLVAQGSPFLLMWVLMPNNLTTPWTQLSSLEGSWILQPRATCTSPFLIFSGKICDHDLTGTSLLLMNF